MCRIAFEKRCGMRGTVIVFSSTIVPANFTYGPNQTTRAPGAAPATLSSYEWLKYEVTSTVRRKKPEGMAAILNLTPYYHQKWYRVNGYQYAAGGYRQPSQWMADMDATLSTVPLDLQSQAWTDLYSKMQKNKFDTATFLGELPETIRWIAGIGKEMMDAYVAVKQGRWTKLLPTKEVRTSRKGRKYVRIRGPRSRVFTFTRRDGSRYNARLSLDGKLSKRYLEWRFAVTPLISEAQSLLDAYYDQALNPMLVKATGHSYGSVPLVGNRQKGVRSQYGRACAYYTITTSARALQKWGGFNLVHTLWNLLPLSFMVDRFLPVGEFLGNLDAEFGVEWKSYTSSVRYKYWISSQPPTGGVWVHAVSTAFGEGYIRELTKPSQFDLLPKPRIADDLTTALDLLALTRTIGESLLKR